jgi:hypothetical protein
MRAGWLRRSTKFCTWTEEESDNAETQLAALEGLEFVEGSGPVGA